MTTQAFKAASSAAAESLTSAPPPGLSGAAAAGSANLAATQKKNKSWDGDWEKKKEEEEESKKKDWKDKDKDGMRGKKKEWKKGGSGGGGKKWMKHSQSDIADLASTAASNEGYLDPDAGAMEEEGEEEQEDGQRQEDEDNQGPMDGDENAELENTESHPDGASMESLGMTESELTEGHELAVTQEIADMEVRNECLALLGLAATAEDAGADLANTGTDLAATEAELAPESLANTESEPLPDVAATGKHYGKENFHEHWQHGAEEGKHKLVFTFSHAMTSRSGDMKSLLEEAARNGQLGPDGGITLWAANNDLKLLHASGPDAIEALNRNADVAVYQVWIKAKANRFLTPVKIALPTVPTGRTGTRCPGLPGFPQIVLFPDEVSVCKLVDVNPDLDALVQTRGVNTTGNEVFYPSADDILSKVSQVKRQGADGAELTVFSLSAPPARSSADAEEGGSSEAGAHFLPLERAFALLRYCGFHSEKHLRDKINSRDEKHYMTIFQNQDGSKQFSVHTAAVKYAKEEYARIVAERCPRPNSASAGVVAATESKGDRTVMKLQDLLIDIQCIESSQFGHSSKSDLSYMRRTPWEYLSESKDGEERGRRYWNRTTKRHDTDKASRYPVHGEHAAVFGVLVLEFRLLSEIQDHLQKVAEREGI